VWSRKLETLANIAVLLAAVSIVAVNVAPRFATRPSVPGRYQAGDKLAETDQLKFGQPTLIINTASTCGYCTASMPFYQRLQKSGVRTIAVTPEPIETNAAYLSDHGIQPSAVLSAPANGLRFSGTPAVLLVDAKGVIRGAWMGKQRPEGEDEILRALK
jgi:hypothetical protein